MRASLFALLALLLVGAIVLLVVSRAERSPAVATPAARPAEAQAALDGAELQPLRRPAESERPAAVPPSVASAAPAEDEQDAPRLTYATLRVVDALTREPLAGASVESLDAQATFHGTTDEQGEVSLPVREGASYVRVLVELDPYLHFRGHVQLPQQATLELWPLQHVRGRVVDARSAVVIPGAVVGFDHPSCSRNCPPDAATADARGEFELAIASDRGRVTLTAEGPEHPWQSVTLDLVQRDERGWIVDVPLERGRAITGVVVDLVSGEPVEGVRIGLPTRLGSELPTTDVTGRFRTYRLRSEWTGSLELLLDKAGYCRTRVELAPERSDEPLRLPVVRSVHVVGTVTDESGAPALGAYLQVPTASGGEKPPDPSSPLAALPPGVSVRSEVPDNPLVRVDDAGAFELAVGLVPWTDEHVVLVVADGFEDALFVVPAAEPGAVLHHDVILRRRSGGTVWGVLTLNGEQIDAVVTARARDGTTVGRSSGDYEIDVGPGTVELSVSLNHEPDLAPLAEATLEVGAGERVRQDFRLERPTGHLRGRVRWTDGTPAAHATVLVSHPSHFRQLASDAEGAFAIELPDLGVTWTVVVRSGWSQEQRTDVPLGAEDVVLTLERPGLLRVRAVDAAHASIPSPVVAWRRPDAPHWVEATRFSGDLGARALADGGVELDVPAGLLEVRVGKPAFDHPFVHRDVRVLADATLELDVALATVAPLRFRVDPPLPEGVWIRAVPADTPAGAEDGAEGGLLDFERGTQARLPGLADGSYRLSVVPDVLAVTPATFRLAGDRAGAIELTWTSK